MKTNFNQFNKTYPQIGDYVICKEKNLDNIPKLTDAPRWLKSSGNSRTPLGFDFINLLILFSVSVIYN